MRGRINADGDRDDDHKEQGQEPQPERKQQVAADHIPDRCRVWNVLAVIAGIEPATPVEVAPDHAQKIGIVQVRAVAEMVADAVPGATISVAEGSGAEGCAQVAGLNLDQVGDDFILR